VIMSGLVSRLIALLAVAAVERAGVVAATVPKAV